jgi:hypothetical protein
MLFIHGKEIVMTIFNPNSSLATSIISWSFSSVILSSPSVTAIWRMCWDITKHQTSQEHDNQPFGLVVAGIYEI